MQKYLCICEQFILEIRNKIVYLLHYSSLLYISKHGLVMKYIDAVRKTGMGKASTERQGEVRCS